MTGIYFSGTGNTKHCVEEFVRCFDTQNQAFSIETPEIDKLLANESTIVFGHPTHFSNAPKMVGDFILSRKELFRGKKIFIIAVEKPVKRLFGIFNSRSFMLFLPRYSPETRYIEPLCSSFRAKIGTKIAIK